MTDQEVTLPVPGLPPGTTAGYRGLYSFDERPHPHVAPLTFVGGTGRSGTHIVARYLGKHGRLASIPVECLFHVEDKGFPGLLAGTTTKAQFVERLRGYWWQGKQRGRERGMFRFVPPEVFEHAVSEFERDFDSEPELACRALFYNLLWPWAVKRAASGLIEQSCDTIAAAPTLIRIFPEARWVHVVRDGRDTSASRVAQTKGMNYPRTRRQGLRWWENRINRIDEGSKAIPDGRFYEVGLDALLSDAARSQAAVLAHFVDVRMGRRMRRFFHGQISVDQANAQRWLIGLSKRRQARYDRLYVEALGRLEADDVSCVPLLRRAYERPAADPSPE